MRARGAQRVGVVLAEEEVVQRFVQHRAAHAQKAVLGQAFLHLVVVHEAVVDRLGLGVVADFPQFGDVLERHHEAAPRLGVVHGRHARALAAVERVRRIGAPVLQLGVEQHHRVRQVVGGHHPLAVARDGDVAHVDAGAHLGHHLQVPQVVLGDPAVARAEVDVAPVRCELGPAVQGKAAGKAVDDLEAVAVEQRDVVVAAFDHHEQVHRVGLPPRAGRPVAPACGFLAAGGDVGVAPARRRRDRGVDPLGQGGDFVGLQGAGKRQHLGCRAAVADHLERFRLAQSRQAFGQQRGAHAAQALLAVAAGAVLLVERRRVDAGRGGRGRRLGRQRAAQQRQNEQASAFDYFKNHSCLRTSVGRWSAFSF